MQPVGGECVEHGFQPFFKAAHIQSVFLSCETIGKMFTHSFGA